MTTPFLPLFKTRLPIIGMVHLKPLVGFEGHESLEQVRQAALFDAEQLVAGGVDGIIIENNYDLPHQINVSESVVSCMTEISAEIRRQVTVPLGVCVLWNDYKASFRVAVAAQAQFIRIPVFVDRVESNYGIAEGNPKLVLETQKSLGAQKIPFITDIHVKHSKLLSNFSLAESAALAQKSGSAGVIVTGNWTGNPPTEADLISVKQSCPGLTMIVGSGCSTQNITKIFKQADAVIVGTALKEGQAEDPTVQVNIKGFDKRISRDRVRALVQAAGERI